MLAERAVENAEQALLLLETHLLPGEGGSGHALGGGRTTDDDERGGGGGDGGGTG